MLGLHENPVAGWLAQSYIRHQLKNFFHSIQVRGIQHLQNLSANTPVMAFSNHTNWWDGLLIYFLTRHAPQKKFFCMMDSRQLQRHRLLSWICASAVDLSNPIRAAVAVRYALRMLESPKSLVWIFPQGELTSSHESFHVRPGTNYLATRAPHAQLLPAAFRYEFIGESKPHVLIEIAPPYPAKESSDERIEKECVSAIARIDRSLQSMSLQEFNFSLLDPAPKTSIASST